MNGFASAMEVFLSTRSADATADALAELAAEAGIGSGEMPAPPPTEGPTGELEIYSCLEQTSPVVDL